MKILRMTGMALVVILMSVHFVACNDDNDDDDPIGEIELLEGEWGLIYEGDFDSNGCSGKPLLIQTTLKKTVKV